VAAKSGLNRSISDAGWEPSCRSVRQSGRSWSGRDRRGPPAHQPTCSECGHVDSDNRVSQAVFRCLSCGHKAHADVNAARNILRAGLAPPTARRPEKKLAASAAREVTSLPSLRACLRRGSPRPSDPDKLPWPRWEGRPDRRCCHRAFLAVATSYSRSNRETDNVATVPLGEVTCHSIPMPRSSSTCWPAERPAHRDPVARRGSIQRRGRGPRSQLTLAQKSPR